MGQRGPKPGSGGRPKKPIVDKITDGNPGKRPLTVIDFKGNAADLEGEAMPKPTEFLSAKQKDGSTLCAAEIYETVWKWLSDRGCAAIVSPQLMERFAMASARWIQCESITSELGFLAKHPTTGAAIQSPYVAIANTYMRMLLCECDADERCKKHQNGDEGEAERAAHGNGGKPPAEHLGIPVVADTGVRSQEQHSNGGDFNAACRSGGAAADNH